MRVIAAISLLSGILLFPGCSKSPTPVVTLSVNANGRPELEYAGPGMFDYQRDVGKFTMVIDLVPGTRISKIIGLLKGGESNDVSLFFQSSSAEPYDIRLMGFCTNYVTDVPLEKTAEILEMPEGNFKTNLNRFLIYMQKPPPE